MKTRLGISLLLIASSLAAPAQSDKKEKAGTPDLTHVSLEPADFAALPEKTERVDIFLLLGQSNMKGRGAMPETPLRDPQIVMMHLRTDDWFLARHPLHLVGDPVNFEGADNAGVGPGLAFAQTLAETDPKTRIALIPCAVGGTRLGRWQKGQKLYEEAVRRAKLALRQGPEGKTRIAGALWLQGESDSQTPERIAAYPAAIAKLIGDLRADLAIPDLPFLACTIGELKPESAKERAAINEILLKLPEDVPHTACIDSRSFAKDIGDRVHFDTPTQEEHGRRFADAYLRLRQQLDGE